MSQKCKYCNQYVYGSSHYCSAKHKTLYHDDEDTITDALIDLGVSAIVSSIFSSDDSSSSSSYDDNSSSSSSDSNDFGGGDFGGGGSGGEW